MRPLPSAGFSITVRVCMHADPTAAEGDRRATRKHAAEVVPGVFDAAVRS